MGVRSGSRSRPAARSSPSPAASTNPRCQCRAALAALPDLLDRVDAYIADGTITARRRTPPTSRSPPRSASRHPRRPEPLIQSRPAAGLAERFIPNYPGHTPLIFLLPPAARGARRRLKNAKKASGVRRSARCSSAGEGG